MRELDSSGFQGAFDFFYIPWDWRNNFGRGYAFMHFIHGTDAARFYLRFHQERFAKQGVVPLEIVLGDVQGDEVRQHAAQFFSF